MIASFAPAFADYAAAAARLTTTKGPRKKLEAAALPMLPDIRRVYLCLEIANSASEIHIHSFSKFLNFNSMVNTEASLWVGVGAGRRCSFDCNEVDSVYNQPY